MKIVLPVSKSDAEALPLLVDVIVRHGRIGDHSVLLVPTPSAGEVAEQQAERLRPLCDSVQVAHTQVEFPGGWPMASSQHWAWVVRYLDNSGNHEPWLWMEADAVPLRTRWADMLALAYKMGGQPFFGYVRPTKWKRDDGTIFYQEGDNMLLGVAIYPPFLSRDVEILPLLNNLTYTTAPPNPSVPWDLYLRWLFFRRGVKASNVIYDRWRTGNYRRENGKLVCDPMPDSPTAEGGVIPEEAVICHGCKDGSLQALLTPPVVTPQAPLKVAPPVVATPVVPVAQPKPAPVAAPQPAPAGQKVPVDQLSEDEKRLLAAIESMKRPRLSNAVIQSGVEPLVAKRSLARLGYYQAKKGGWLMKV